MFTYILCVISHGFIGILAQTTEPVTTLRPIDERICVPGFVCRHGHCVKSDFLECICDPGWIGTFCEKHCPVDCGQHGKCMMYNEKPTCVCDWRYTGSFCDKIKFPTTTVVSESTTQITNITSLSTSLPQNLSTTMQPLNMPTTNALSTTDQGQQSLGSYPSTSTTQILLRSSTSTSPITLVPESSITVSLPSTTNPITTSTSSTLPPATTSLSSPAASTNSPQRTECFPGFICQHGQCPEGRLICICDEGWVGPFCEWKCNLTCGDNGHCNSYSDGGVFCNCKPGYTGDHCDIFETTIPETTTIPTTISSTNHTLPPKSQENELSNLKQCKPGFTCLNGICNKIDTKPSCICEFGYMGLFCEKKCPITCDMNEICELHSNGSAFCSCNWTHTGLNCTKLRPDPDEFRGDQNDPVWYWYLIGSCIVLLVILLILVVVIPYCMWKRREIFIMKIMYMFQPYEDDDDKMFDAFISYKSTAKDEDFVLRQLFPRLETENNFKLCLHFRDFIPGENISNNIIWAVENSRRTILILTPDYIQSEFCRFEYQRAQHEMLNRKQRIIPIILEDVSNQMNYMDNALRSIVKSITYLTWPGEKKEADVNKFWKRLELSLPKKRQERNLCKTKGKSKPENVKLRRFSRDIRPSNTDDNDFVRLSIDDESILNEFRNSRDTNSMTVLM
ncbi:hypothetical protein LOTGIDRAFT_152123 [Lottia gigantea]|uniref:TIR domain-containing protein n=1 Tax=Lottia gigantea TaxID=225164 RepID=V4BH64_LOTGI|nr:hypothetical protein LOTGIDRAFT_152123 [Lottia gigantea]ESP05292.1 hypothetical protein LOTGIDRAFT_152123 [Lottia gigantea]